MYSLVCAVATDDGKGSIKERLDLFKERFPKLVVEWGEAGEDRKIVKL